MMSGKDEEFYVYRGVTYVARRHDPDLQEWQVGRVVGDDAAQIGSITKDDQDYRPYTAWPGPESRATRATEWDSLKEALKHAAENF